VSAGPSRCDFSRRDGRGNDMGRLSGHSVLGTLVLVVLMSDAYDPQMRNANDSTLTGGTAMVSLPTMPDRASGEGPLAIPYRDVARYPVP
jgi:hypothetical protein